MFTTEAIFIIIISVEFIVGVLGNGYIVLVNWIDWIKKKKISSIDYILTSLAISRICLVGTIVLHGILIVLYPHAYENHKLQVFLFSFWTIFNYLSMYFVTCLSVFYFLKVASFSHPLFLWLKWRIDRMVHWILLGCFAISLLVFFVLEPILSCTFKVHRITNHKRNGTEMFNVSKIHYFEPLTLFNLFAMIPFIISLISFFLLMVSLWRHTKQMKLNATGCRDPSIEAHVRAMKIIISFFFFFFIYCVVSLLVTFSYLMVEQKLIMMIGEIIAFYIHWVTHLC
nr:taste receptor type 2 member 8-like [Castor canadensis]